ncbi:MAG: TonB-dependent receptor [Cytophagales bacterium]|nr:TonB-dependent receptor [Cytophagales bacterium]
MKKFNYLRQILNIERWPKTRLTIMLWLLIASTGWAQSGTITGKVTSLENSDGLPGVSILVKGTSTGVITDINGDYSIEASSSDILVFSYVGYVTEEVEIGSKSVIDLSMTPDITSLEEIIVVGYGTMKKSDLTGAVSQVTAEDFEKQPLVRTEDALKGRAAGVVVSNNTGTPGGDIKIRVRGANSITGNNDPLIVIDGVIGGNLRTLNTNDIASFDVLKDASATAIYGSRGANGVIIVNTKKGSGAPQLELNYFHSIANVPDRIDIMSARQFSELYDRPITKATDYQDEYLQTGHADNLQFNISGKANKIGYFVSGGYVTQTGNIINTGYDRYNIRANLNMDVTEKLKIGLNVFGSREKRKNFTQGGLRPDSDQRAGITAALSWDPTLPPWNDDGTPNITSPFGSILDNPLIVQTNRDNNSWEDRINTNLNISYDILEELKFTSILGINLYNTMYENYQDYQIYNANGFAGAGGGHSRTEGYQWSNILTWNKEIGKHNIKLTGIYEITGSERRNGGFSATNYIFPATYAVLEIAEIQRANADYNKNTLQSYVGRLEYNFNNNLFVTGTIRHDASSKFREDQRSATFPSVGLAYSLGEAGFIQSNNLFDNIKLRAGYGETGNQNVDNYLTYPTLSTGANYPLDGATETVGLAPGRFANPNLHWETTKQINAGIDFMFLEGRLNFSVDYYKKNTTDLLLNVPVPAFAGGGTITANQGEVQNSGFEFLLSGIVIDNDKWNWNSSFTASKNNNEVISLAGGQTQQVTGSTVIGGTGLSTHIYRVGEPLGSFYGAQFLGTWKTSDAEDNDAAPGDAKYLTDENGDLILDIIGNGTPKFNWGWNNTVNFGGFDFNMFITGAHDFQILNATRSMISLATGNVLHATSTEYLNRWTPENENDIPASGQNINQSTRYIEDGDFVRLSNLSLGYTIPVSKGIRSLRLYISAQNAFIITNYSGYDPESSSASNSVSAGINNNDVATGLDYGAIPNPKTYTFGINIGI